MNVLSSFENRLERAVEGFFARLFRSGIHPVEIGKRIQRVMEDGKVPALKRVYVPNRYRIELSTADHSKLAAVESQIIAELEVFIAEAARQREWVLAGPAEIEFIVDSKLTAGEFRVKAAEVSVTDDKVKKIRPPANATRPVAVLALLGPDGQHKKRVRVGRRVVIGRAPECELALDDKTVSRQHAEIVDVGIGEWKIRDLGSRNGTTVNGTTTSEARLTNGDRIGIGSSALEFRTS